MKTMRFFHLWAVSFLFLLFATGQVSAKNHLYPDNPKKYNSEQSIRQMVEQGRFMFIPLQRNGQLNNIYSYLTDEFDIDGPVWPLVNLQAPLMVDMEHFILVNRSLEGNIWFLDLTFHGSDQKQTYEVNIRIDKNTSKTVLAIYNTNRLSQAYFYEGNIMPYDYQPAPRNTKHAERIARRTEEIDSLVLYQTFSAGPAKMYPGYIRIAGRQISQQDYELVYGRKINHVWYVRYMLKSPDLMTIKTKAIRSKDRGYLDYAINDQSGVISYRLGFIDKLNKNWLLTPNGSIMAY